MLDNVLPTLLVVLNCWTEGTILPNSVAQAPSNAMGSVMMNGPVFVMAQTLPSAPPAVSSSPSDRANPLWPWILMGTAGGLGVGLGLYCLRRTSAQPRPLHRDATPLSSPVPAAAQPSPSAATPKAATISRPRGKTQGKRRSPAKPSGAVAPAQVTTQATPAPHQQVKHKPSGPVVPSSQAATAPQQQGKPMARSPLSSVPPPLLIPPIAFPPVPRTNGSTRNYRLLKSALRMAYWSSCVVGMPKNGGRPFGSWGNGVRRMRFSP